MAQLLSWFRGGYDSWEWLNGECKEVECKNGKGDPSSTSSDNHWGIFLLKVGSRMVYSTCSLNPVKNEAAVSEILWKCGKPIKLVDVSFNL